MMMSSTLPTVSFASLTTDASDHLAGAIAGRNLYDVDLRELNGLWCALGQNERRRGKGGRRGNGSSSKHKTHEEPPDLVMLLNGVSSRSFQPILRRGSNCPLAVSFLLRATPRRSRKENAMNWDRVEGNWKQVTGKVKEKWGKLTDDDLTVINGKQDQLVGRVQERYGIAKDEAERQVKEWADRM